jgi:hypothetical protein
MLTLAQAIVARDSHADVFDLGGTAQTVGALRYVIISPYEPGMWLADVGQPLGWVDLLDLDPSQALLSHHDLVRPVLCGCENRTCPHSEAPCATLGGPDGPRMKYVGAVCVPCAREMARDAPGYVTAPYGTYLP